MNPTLPIQPPKTHGGQIQQRDSDWPKVTKRTTLMNLYFNNCNFLYEHLGFMWERFHIEQLGRKVSNPVITQTSLILLCLKFQRNPRICSLVTHAENFLLEHSITLIQMSALNCPAEDSKCFTTLRFPVSFRMES